MRIGELEISAELNRSGSPYSAQEDILLQFKLENHSAAQALAPMIASLPCTLFVKKGGSTREDTIRWTPAPRPGLPKLADDPEVNLEPGQIWAPGIPLQNYLGFVARGKYSVKFKLESSKYPFSTDWMDFEVNGLKVGFSSTVPSTQGEARYLHHAWLDLGSSPARILFRRPSIGKERPLPHRTQVIGEGDPASEPHGSSAPPGPEPATAFVGWLEKDSLHLARIKGNDSVSNHALKVPFNTDSISGPYLAYSEQAGGTSAQLSGLVLVGEKPSYTLHALRMAPPSPATWLPPFDFPPGRILAFRLIPINPALRVALFVRDTGGELSVECMYWEEGKPMTFHTAGTWKTGPTGFQAMGAALVEGHLKWALALLDGSLAEKSRRIHVVSHGFNLSKRIAAAGVPKSRAYAAQPGPVRISLEVDAEGTPWLLQRDAHGAWVQSPGWEEAIPVDTPRGSLRESLFFRRGALPRVLVLDPDSGFQIRPVEFPTGGTDEEDVDVNE